MKKVLVFLFGFLALAMVGCSKEGYSIKYEINGHGNPVEEITNVSQLPETLPVLTEEGWEFEGWFYESLFQKPAVGGESIEKDTVLYAKWKEVSPLPPVVEKYNVTYITNGHGLQPEELLNVTMLPSSFPVLSEEGWTFGGWFLDNNTFLQKAVENKTLTANITLYAKWVENPIPKYNVSYVINGHGTQPENLTEVTALPTDLPVLTEEGWQFDGWYTDNNTFQHQVEANQVLTEDITLYAKWIWIDPDSVLEGYEALKNAEESVRKNLSVDGYAQYGIGDFRQYLNTNAYRVVKTPLEFLSALVAAKYDYTNTWDEESKTITQTLNKEGTVHVIEIANDLNLGYLKLGAQEKATNLVVDYASNMNKLSPYLCMSDMLKENGMSQIKIENTSNLLIYSKNGAKITHCGFKLMSDTNIVFRNLEFDELWQWEDAPVSTSSKIGDYDWFGWAYFKISFCGFIWIDHCTFGKSYDGQIDYANPVYDANAGTAFRAPYGGTGENGLQISWCKFNAGSDDPSGYLYKMMESIEQEYQEGKKNYLYYNALRDANISFEDILYGLAIPQKKGFLCGDDAKFSGSYETADDYNFNLKLKVSFANCIFNNLEDRLPKLRGGNAYLYNCLVDSSQYYAYRTKLLNANARGAVTKINSGWKCALVSQGIVCGNGGSVQAENTIFRGIDTLLKHNDTKNVSPYVDGGFNIVNCSYQKGEGSRVYTGSSSDINSIFISSIPSKLNPENFSWKTKDEQPPFIITGFKLEELENILKNATYGCGTNHTMQQMLLKNDYIIKNQI